MLPEMIHSRATLKELLACLRPLFVQSVETALHQPVSDAEALWRLAENQRVIPLLRQHFLKTQSPELPFELQNRFRRSAPLAALNCLRVSAQLADILREFESAKIRVLPF